jgi:hypothetical protein
MYDMGKTCIFQRNMKTLVGKSQGLDTLSDLDIGGRIILKSITEKQTGKVWTASTSSEQGQTADFCDEGNEFWSSIKSRNFSTNFNNSQELKKNLFNGVGYTVADFQC